MNRIAVWIFGCAVALLAVRGLVALNRTDGLSDGGLGLLTFALCAGGVWAIYMREERDS